MLSIANGMGAMSLTWLFSWWLERWLKPKPIAAWQRQSSANWAHLLGLSLAFGVCLAVTARPWLAAFLVLVFFVVLVMVNASKQEQLREPFVAADWVYFTDVIRHPGLYLPFFGYGRATAIIVGVIFVLTLWWQLEPAAYPWQTRAAGLAIMFLGTWLGIWLAKRDLVPRLSLDPNEDMKRWGLVACLLAHHGARHAWRQAHRPIGSPPQWTKVKAPLQESNLGEAQGEFGRNTDSMPHLICVQAESFCDVRRAYPYQAPTNWLAKFDEAKADAWASGCLTVPAWGANTARTEFAFLTGMDPAVLGIYRFDPYALVARTPRHWWQNALAAQLRSAGYHGCFLHPYAAHFYQRDRVIAQLGFNEFIDLRAFNRRSGTQTAAGGDQIIGEHGYVTDITVARRIVDYLAHHAGNKPCFIHAVTMAGHGPYSDHEDNPHLALHGYLRRMHETDLMIGELLNALSTLSKPVVLCIFGDHVPMLPSVYRELGMPDGRTDYVIWRNPGCATARSPLPTCPARVHDCAAHELSALMLAAAGLAGRAP